MVLGVLLLFGFIPEYLKSADIAAHGVRTAAFPTRVRWADQSGFEYAYYAQVRFKDEGGTWIEAKVDLPSDLGKQLRQEGGKPVVILYSPKDPLDAQLDGNYARDQSLMFIAGGVACIVAGVVVFAWRARRGSRAKSQS